MKDRNQSRREAPDDRGGDQFADTRPLRPIRDTAPARQASERAADQFADTRPIKPQSSARPASLAPSEHEADSAEAGAETPARRAPKNVVEQFSEIAMQYDDTRPIRPVQVDDAPDLSLREMDDDELLPDEDGAEPIPQAVLDAMADLEANEPDLILPEESEEGLPFAPASARPSAAPEVTPEAEDDDLEEEPFVPLDLEWDAPEQPVVEATTYEEVEEQDEAGEGEEGLEDTGPLPELPDLADPRWQEAGAEAPPDAPEQFSDTRPLPPIGGQWQAEEKADDEAE